MKLIGISYSTNEQGKKSYNLYVADDFNDYSCDAAAGRGCEGQLCDKTYAGTYDCSTLKVGMEIDVLYDKAIVTTKELFNQLKRLRLWVNNLCSIMWGKIILSPL